MRDGSNPRNKRDSSPRNPEAPPIQSSSKMASLSQQVPSISNISMPSGSGTVETSVAPRLRPKATTVVPNVPSISPVPPVGLPHLRVGSLKIFRL